MRNDRLISTIVAAALAAAASACGDQMEAPERQTTTGETPRMEEITVTGCLQAGLDERTFVLMTREGARDTATYQLTNTNEFNLRDHVNQLVQVTGTLRAEQEFASSGRSTEDDRARGTTGEPTVETKAEVEVKRLVVDAVKPTGENCPD